MVSRKRTVLLALAGISLAVSQVACTGEGEGGGQNGGQDGGTAPAASASATSAPPASGAPQSPPASRSAAPAGDILAGKRQVVIRPVQSFESILAVDATGRLGPIDGDTDKGLFVITPVSGKYQIRTAKAETGGEPSCMGVKNNGSAPLTVVAAACDTSRPGQLFDIRAEDTKDAQGRPAYAISSQSAFLQIGSGGLIAEELGDAPLRTTYTFVDNGPSTLQPVG